MERRDTILAAMSPAGTGQFTPVRIQKLLFLIDRNIARDTDGPHFQFEPYAMARSTKMCIASLRC